MIISDLNHLEIVSEETKVVGGWYYYNPADIDFDKDVDIDFDADVDVDIDVTGNSDVHGVTLNAEASFLIDAAYPDALGSAESGVTAIGGVYAGFANATIAL